MLNVYEQIDNNKRRTFLIMAGFIFFVVGFIYLLGQALKTDPGIIFFAIIFSLVSSIGSYFWGDKIILSISKAKPATKKENYNFYTAAENLAIAAQIPTPRLYVIESSAMNAFATGRNPKNAVVCATTGLIENLNKSELEAVVAHEISHIINYDILLSTIVAVLVGTITLISDWVLRTGLRSTRSDRRNQNPLTIIVAVFALIVTPIAAKLIQLALSRQREYFADASAAKLTRHPQGLISALKKLELQTQPLKNASSATAHLYITNPFGSKKLSGLTKMFSTHPPIEQRVAMLEKML
jgi:heat shock protein HtpX